MAERKYVIFRLDKEEYGVDIMAVKEVSEIKESIRVPNTPNFIDGIINIRGDITPIINLKKRFNILDDDSIKDNSRIIIVNIKNKLVGFLVDEASQVLSIDEKNIDPTPEIIAGADRLYIQGIGKLENRMVIILDLEKVLNEDEQMVLSEMNA